MIAGLILAAGESRRMGSLKPLLKVNGITFLEHMMNVLSNGGVNPVTVVLGHEADKIKDTVLLDNAHVIINSEYRQGQLSSIQCGIRYLDSLCVDGVLISPVDIPLVSSSLVKIVLTAAVSSGKNIVIPVYENRRGHPAYFSRRLFPKLLEAPLNEGARWVIHRYPDEVLEIPTDEEGIILNINTPQSYKTHIQDRD